MPASMSHQPELNGDTVRVPAAGSLVIDTELRDLQSFVCSLAEDAVGTAATVSWELVTQDAGTSRKVTIKTWDEDGVTAGSTAAWVTWMALGK